MAEYWHWSQLSEPVAADVPVPELLLVLQLPPPFPSILTVVKSTLMPEATLNAAL